MDHFPHVGPRQSSSCIYLILYFSIGNICDVSTNKDLLTLLHCVDTSTSHGERISKERSVSMCVQLSIRPDAFCLIYAIPKVDADAFRRIKFQ